MKKLLLLLFTIPFLAIGQEKGIQFEHGTTWEKVKAKAKAENKHIFVDAFTTWCGPCKYMSSTIFPQEKVGTFFNKNFVNLKIQMDETEGDNADVKSWRAEAKRFAKDYSITAYPTFLIFDPNGELVHRIVGGGEADQFIALAGEGLNPETQYVTLLKKFEANPTDVATAKVVAAAASKAYDKATADKALGVVIDNSSADELLTKESVSTLTRAASSTKSKAFDVIRKNKAKVDELTKPGYADQILGIAIINSEIVSKVRGSKEDILDQVVADVEKTYADVDMKNILASYKPNYYASKKNWPKYRDAVNAYIAVLGDKTQASQYNSFAWTIFENCTDPACLDAAIKWAEAGLKKEETAALLDTYANVLHKAGKTKEAIVAQEKAISLVDAQSKAEYEKTLALMKKGLPTWETE